MNCEHCGSDQLTPEGYRRTIMVEVPGVYDGGLFYQCPDCGGRWHRWEKGGYLYAKADPYVRGAVIGGE